MAALNDPINLDNLPWLPHELVQFAAAWRHWRGGQLLPRRNLLKLDDITSLLPRVMVLEMLSPDEALLRLVGTSYFEMFGVELTGLNFIDLAGPENRQVRSQRLWAMATLPCGSYMATADPNPTRIGNIIHSLTLPMLPAISGKPMQFFAVTFGTVPADLIDKYGLEMVESRADEFSYVDIGAGVPDGPEY